MSDDTSFLLSPVECRSPVPTGRLVACDPFCALEKEGNRFVTLASFERFRKTGRTAAKLNQH